MSGSPPSSASRPWNATSELEHDQQPLLRDSLAIAILLLLITALFADVLFFGSSLVAGDLTQYHFPMKKVVRDLVLSGRFPAWNRLLEAGQPIAANPAYEVFYPPQWLIFLPSFVFGFKLHILVHYYLAAIGMYAFIRELRMQPAAALIAAVAFAAGGPLMSMNAYLPFLFSMSWLPWMLFFALRFHRSGRTSDFTLAAVAIAMQFLIGEPTVIAESAVLLIVGAVLLRRTPAAMAMLAAGVGIAAVQFIPMIGHVRDSVRSIPLDFWQVAKWSTAPLRPAELFVGSTVTDARRFAGPGRPFIDSIYLGLPVAMFGLAGFARRLRFWRTAGLTILALYIVAIGAHTPLLGALYRARLFTTVRFPEKFLFGALFVFLVFAASSIDAALNGDERLRRFVVVAACVLLAVAVFAAAATSPAFVRLTWLITAGVNPARYVAVDRTEWFGAALRAALLVTMLALFKRRAARLAFSALAIVDIVALTVSIPIRLPDRFFADAPPLLRQMPSPSYRIYHQLGIERAIRGARPLVGPSEVTQWIVRNEMLPNVPMAWNVAMAMGYDADETTLLPSRRFRAAMDIAMRQHERAWPLTFMAMSNAPFTVLPLDFQSASRAAGGDLERLTTARVVRAPVGADRYSFASQVVPCSSIPDCVTKLRGADTAVALVPPSVPPVKVAPGMVARVAEQPTWADLDVRASGPSFLKISVTFHKYWSATIDNRPATIVPSNLAYQGLFVPAGAHHIHLQYRNPLITIGGAITLLTLLLLLAASFSQRRKRPRVALASGTPNAIAAPK